VPESDLSEPRPGSGRRCARPPRWLSLLLASGTVVMISLAGCDRDPATAPSLRAPGIGGPLFDPTPAPAPPEPEGDRLPYGLKLALGVPDQLTGAHPPTVVGQITRRIVARMRIRQRVIEGRDGDPYHHLEAGPRGVYFAFMCELKAFMYSTYPNGGEAWRMPGGSCGNSGEPWEVWDTQYMNPSTLYGSRAQGTGLGRGDCPGGCYNYSGSSTFILTPIALTLQVKAVPKRLVTGYEVKFTASRSNGAALTAVESWHWVPADTTKPRVALTACGTSKTCTITATESGWGVANAVIDGAIETAKDYVEVLGCRTDDLLLDNVVIRDKLKALWDSSYDSANPSNRRERTMVVYDSAGVIITRNIPLDPTATPCKIPSITFPNPPPGTLVADFHTHPFRRGEEVPTSCGYPPGTIYADEGYGGLSAKDWRSTLAPTNHSVYAYDADSVYRASSGLTANDFEPHPQTSKIVPKDTVWGPKYRTWVRRQTGTGTCSIIS
jgi:hypothetical protein